MGVPILDSKLALRRRMRAELKLITTGQRAAASARACALLQAQTVWKEAESILFYAPMPGELDVWPLLVEALRVGKTAALPRFQAETGDYTVRVLADALADVQVGAFGIREPVARCAALSPVKKLDLLLIPGLAFDLNGHRLGRGKGYYDQLLATVRGTRIGVAFDQQIVSGVPVEPHDVRLNGLLTPTRWILL